MTKVIKYKSFKFIYFPGDCLAIIMLGKHFLTISRPIKVFSKVREFLPYFSWVSFFDCDSARFYCGQAFFSWNLKDYKKKRVYFTRHSDGTNFSDISILDYLKARFANLTHKLSK